MLKFNLEVFNPWDSEFKSLYAACGDLPIKNKHWESELMRDNILLKLSFSFTVRDAHAGLKIEFGLFGLVGYCMIYDSRHWDYANNCWKESDV